MALATSRPRACGASRRSRRSLAAAALALGAALGGSGAVAAGPDEKSPSVMVKRWRAAAEAADAAAFEKVVAEYRKSGLDETLRGLLVATVCDAAHGDAARARIRAWRAQDAAPKDAWLWYRSLVDEAVKDPQPARDAALHQEGPVIRAAAVHALATCADPDALAMLPGAVTAIDAAGVQGVHKALLVEAWAQVIAGQPARSGSVEFDAAVKSMIPTLSDAATDARTKLVIARALRRAFETEGISLDPKWWLSLLQRTQVPVDPAIAVTRSSRFFDVEATGDRIVYVLDASDSMHEMLSPSAIAALKALSPAEPPDPANPGTRPSVPWKSVRTSIDAVAEFTKLSIRALPASASFCIVVFGSDAKTLDATPSLVPATPSRVADAAKELEALQRKGRGLGSTNLHAALRRAFAASVVGKVAAQTDVLAAATQGATTLFVLSDGAPTRDEWDDTVKVADNRPTFAGAEPLTDDVERMNLLQACEIHTIAFGFTDDALLPSLARVGGGHSRTIAAPAAVDAANGVAASKIPHIPDTASGRELAAFLRATAASALTPRDPAHPFDAIAVLRKRTAETTSIDERVVLAYALAERGDMAARTDLLEGLTASTLETAIDADAGLSLLAKRSFGGAAGRRLPDRWALRRNWEWWWTK